MQMQENNRTEFKRELNDRFERAVVSFLNYAGGGEVTIGGYSVIWNLPSISAQA
ncbi:hypothetical protein AGMMS50276_02220 [Synergistales bacterium]|nr:hypothetical protein AGMMS50276_02220 [Synergistales bacterium]